MYMGDDELRRGFDNISRGKEITQTQARPQRGTIALHLHSVLAGK